MKKFVFNVAAAMAAMCLFPAIGAAQGFMPSAAVANGATATWLRSQVDTSLTEVIAIKSAILPLLAVNPTKITDLQIECGSAVDGDIGPQTRQCIDVVAQAIADARAAASAAAAGAAAAASGGGSSGGAAIGSVPPTDDLVQQIAYRYCPPGTDGAYVERGGVPGIDCGSGNAFIALAPDFSSCRYEEGELRCPTPGTQRWVPVMPGLNAPRLPRPEEKGWCEENAGWCGLFIGTGVVAVTAGIVATLFATGAIHFEVDDPAGAN
ncbi:MAG: hypothetical protein ABIG71_04340 [Candidatus Uhrbacteria bacterium]